VHRTSGTKAFQLTETGSEVTPVGKPTEGDEASRDALRQQTTVEQATGWLAGRLNCSLSEASRHLNKLAQDTDTTVAEAAALLLGDGTSPALPRPAPATRGPDAPEGDAAGDAATEPATPPRAAAPIPASVVDVLPVPAMLLAPVTDGNGEITDFVIERLNDNAASSLHDGHGNPITGKRMLRLFPHVQETGLFATLAQTVRTGEPLRLDLFPFQWVMDGKSDLSTVDIRGQRAEGRLLVTWRGHDVNSDRARRLEVTQQLGGLGWAEWNLITKAVTWSHELYAMHGRPLRDGPMSFEDYLGIIHPDDVPLVVEVFRALVDHRDNAQAEYRVLGGDGDIHYLKLAATAVYDPLGKALIMRAVIQDMTASRVTELELAAARSKIERERREAMLQMQQAILPTPELRVQLGRYDIAVRYQPAQSDNRVGGDWYDARIGRDGDAIVAIGDVAGHGLTAAAGMARIGNALRGLTTTGQPASTLLGWLNDLVCGDELPERVASVAIGSLDVNYPRLRWAQAGHPPPVLVRDGESRLLSRPAGMLLGTVPAADYELATEELATGDMLFLYTDGLIERRDRDIDEGLRALLDAAKNCARETATGAIAALADQLAPGADDDVCLLAVHVLPA
jgi:serine phosphatase RsbU (regulator of sigma subunit)/PAS domain-containing protein